GDGALEGHHADPRYQGRRMAVLQAGRGAEKCQRTDASGMVDRELLGHVAAGRVADDVRARCTGEVEELERVTDELDKRERLLRRGHSGVAIPAQIEAHDPRA